MATHHITNESSGNQYYFNTSNTTTSHSYGSSPVAATYGSSVYSAYPVGSFSTSYQQVRLDSSLNTPQQYQSVAGFNKSITEHDYHINHASAPQFRPTARAVSNQDLHISQRSPQPTSVSPQHHHFQFDNRQQLGQPTGPPVVYQTPGAAQFTHRNVDMWTEGSPQNLDHYVQAQRVSVRSVSTGSPQQSHSVSPHRNQEQLQMYYSQLTHEQQQQLLRNQQLQRQKEQNSHHEQQPRVTAQQISPSSSHHHEQHGLAGGFDGGQHNQERRFRSDSERQQQDEQDYYAAQRRLAAQRAQQQQEGSNAQPVGIRNLMTKFSEPGSSQPRSKSSTTTRHYSGSSYTQAASPRQMKTPSFSPYAMTYSSLPKPQEPPVNSVEYYQMQMQKQGGVSFTNIQQAAAPPHIQHTAGGFGALRDRFKAETNPDHFVQPQPVTQQQHSINNHTIGNSLSSIKNQYLNQAKQMEHEPAAPQPAQKISRTIVGEDLPEVHQAQHAAIYQPPTQQSKPVASQTLPQQQQPPPPQAIVQVQKQPTPQISVQKQQQPTPQVSVQQHQQPAPSIPVEKETEAVAKTPIQQEQNSTPATISIQEQAAPSEASPNQQAEPAKAPLQPQTEPAKEAPKKQIEPSKQASESKKETSPQGSSTTPAAKKEPAKTTTKPTDKKSPS